MKIKHTVLSNKKQYQQPPHVRPWVLTSDVGGSMRFYKREDAAKFGEQWAQTGAVAQLWYVVDRRYGSAEPELVETWERDRSL